GGEVAHTSKRGACGPFGGIVAMYRIGGNEGKHHRRSIIMHGVEDFTVPTLRMRARATLLRMESLAHGARYPEAHPADPLPMLGSDSPCDCWIPHHGWARRQRKRCAPPLPLLMAHRS